MQEEIQPIKRRFGIIGNAKALNRAVEIAVQVAPTEMTVLITGESGSGKESFSKIIHHLSPYKHGKFIAINCGAIPEGTIDSELFGHKKGSFTGAAEERKGYFEEADGGTIFLDEIGEMPLGTQARLLRVLEYGEFIKVGASKVEKVQLRVVAATHVNLLEAVEQGKFREDLYYRLNTVPLHIPPLRERGQDIVILFRKFAADFAEKYRVKPIQLTEDAQEALLRYQFPGNIRQLKNLVEQISVLETNRSIAHAQLMTYLPPERHAPPTLYQGNASNKGDAQEREILYNVLFDMKRDMNDLKSLIFEWLSTDAQKEQLIKDHPTLFKSLDTSLVTPAATLQFLPPSSSTVDSEHDAAEPIATMTEDHEKKEQIEEASLSLEVHERILIAKALAKYRNRRKQVADALGISERTLYRKIKQYDLE